MPYFNDSESTHDFMELELSTDGLFAPPRAFSGFVAACTSNSLGRLKNEPNNTRDKNAERKIR
jgi:hypothetical protein